MLGRNSRLRGISDRELVERYQTTRDADCFAEIFDRHVVRVFRIALAILRETSQAEDAVLSTFERALKDINSFQDRDDSSNLERWLVRICKNACLDELRKRRTRDMFAPAVADTMQRNPGNAEQGVLLREAFALLGTLDEPYRVCYLLRLDGFSYQEIISCTGYSFDEVKTYIRTARRNLVKKFERKGT